jgi:hypothetical protein
MVFLNKLLDVYKEMEGPVHYSVVAGRLGLNNSTAYDMLRLLEQKGMVSSVYGTPKGNSGPGRANIFFLPTNESLEVLSHLAGSIEGQERWDDVKSRILKNLSLGKADGYENILNDMLARMPRKQSSLVQCAEFITALLLNLRGVKQELAEQEPVDDILQAPVSKLRMSILVGMILGLSCADKGAQELLVFYREYAEKYEASLQALSHDALLKLHDFTCDVWAIIKSPA